MQLPGAGTRDLQVKWENKTMYAIVTVFALSL